MAINLTPTQPNVVATFQNPGALQGGGNSSGISQNTIAPQATTPTNPKTQYIANQVNSGLPAAQVAQSIPGYTASGYPIGATVNAQGQITNPTQVYGQTTSPQTTYNPQTAPVGSVNPALSSTAPIAPSSFNGQSGGTQGSAGASTGIYDPYQSPAYQQYLQNYLQTFQPSTAQTGSLTALQNIENSLGSSIANVEGQALPIGAKTGQELNIQQQAQAPLQAALSGLGQANTIQQQLQTGATGALNSANTQAGYLGGIATPTPVGGGQSLMQINPTTGQANNLGTAPIANPYSAGTNSLTGVPYTYNQTTGQIASGGTGLGSTPPALGNFNTGNSAENTALGNVAQTYGLTDPASQNALQTAVQNTLASGGNMQAAGVPANLQPAVSAALQQISGGQYSPGNASINYANLQQEQATANSLIAPMQTAVSHLSDLQSLANAVDYSNSPIASNIRNQFSGSILTDPSITNLQSAIGVVRSEVAKVLGGGTPTVASQAEAAEALPDNLSPTNIAGVIANVTALMNAKMQSYTNPANAATLSTGLPGSTNTNINTQTAPPAGTFSLQ